MLAQLEVSSKQCSVFVFEFVTKRLNSIGIDECASCFTFCMDGRGDVASILCGLITNCVDVAVDSAAAILHTITKFGDAILDTIETILQARVDSIEAITDAVGDATELSVYILIVETFEEVRTSECTLHCGVIRAVATKQSTTTKYSKPYKVDEPYVTG